MSTPEELEAERDFLVRSLDDLELEHDSGGIDDESYRELRDDYTARAAATIRALRDGVDARPEPVGARSAKRNVVVVAAIVVFALVAGVALAGAVGVRLPGQTSSGNAQSETAAAIGRQITRLQDDVNANPDDYDLRLRLALAYERNGDVANALEQTDAAITIDPNRAEAHANAGRLLYLASEALPSRSAQTQFVAEAKAAFDKAIEVDPAFVDSYYFRGVLEAFTGRPAAAQADLQTYLVRAPNGRWADDARSLLATVTLELESGSTTTTKP